MPFWKRKNPPASGRPEGEREPRGEGAVDAGDAPLSAGTLGAGPLDAGAPGPAGPGGDGADPSSVLLSGDTRTDRNTVQVLLDAIARVSESRDADSLLDHIVDTAVGATGAERGFLLLEPEPGAEPEVRVARDRRGAPVPAGERWSTSVVARVTSTRVPVRTTVSGHGDLDLGQSVFDLKLRAVMCVPLEVRGVGGASGRRGALYVDSRAATRDFTVGDLALFHALAQHVGIALENVERSAEAVERARLEQSMQLASEIQQGLLPSRLEVPPGWEAHGWYAPAEHASGDFYDAAPVSGGRAAVMVGDVTGHGVGPALLVASVQASLRAFLSVLDEPGACVQRAEADLTQRMDDATFVTLMLLVLSPDGGLATVDAGHGCGLVWRRRTGQVERLGRRGPALGVMPGFAHACHAESALEEGDLALLFTDGISETARPGAPTALFGEEGVRRVLAEVGEAGGSAAMLCEALAAAATEHGGGAREDDWTLVGIRRTGAR